MLRHEHAGARAARRRDRRRLGGLGDGRRCHRARRLCQSGDQFQHRDPIAPCAARPRRAERRLRAGDQPADEDVGLQKSDYGHLAIAQRAWAAHNPYAVYRAAMTMEDYLAAPLVADPLLRYDCVPVVAGAQAIVVAHPDRCPRGRASVRVRAHRASFNYDNQEGDGLQTGISTFAGDLWRAAGVGPEDIDVASIYDDYPAMVLSQLNDLGMILGNDLVRFARRDIGERRFPLNTWGGMLSAGQPGGPAGGLNGISEAVLQLQHRAGARQVEGARLAVTTGYGMTLYRYGGTAAAAVLERLE